MAIIITGNPGVGKHTIAKSVSKILKYKILDINKIALESGLYEKKDKSNDVNVKKLKNILKNKINKKSIVVGHLAPYVLTKKQVTKAIKLRKNPYHLTPVYKKRKYSTKKIEEKYQRCCRHRVWLFGRTYCCGGDCIHAGSGVFPEHLV